MINPNDYVLIYRNGHLTTVGIADVLRGMNQDRITIQVVGSYQTIEVDRTNGVTFEGERFSVKTVSEEKWLEIDKRLNDGKSALRLQQNRVAALEEQRKYDLQQKAEEWYNSLSPEHKELFDIHSWFNDQSL